MNDGGVVRGMPPSCRQQTRFRKMNFSRFDGIRARRFRPEKGRRGDRAAAAEKFNA